MSKLKIALYNRVYEIAIKEKRYSDFLDFVPKFIVDEHIYQISYGTFRNYISELVRDEKVEVVQYAPQVLHSKRSQHWESDDKRPYRGFINAEQKTSFK